MKSGRSKSPGLFSPIAALAVAGLAMAALVGVQLGLIRSPFEGEAQPKPVAQVKAKPKPGGLARDLSQAKLKVKPKPATDSVPETPAVIVHEEGAGEPPKQPEPPKSPARLAYEKKAEGLPATPKGQAELARWCEENQLPDEAKAAWEAVIQLDPDHGAARKKLGYKKSGNGWKTDAMVAEEIDQKRADKDWKERLRVLHKRMHPARGKDSDAVAQQALAELEQVDDPRAAPMLWDVFAGHPSHHLMVAKQLAKLKSPRSSLILAAVAAYSPDEKALRVSIDELKARDPVEFARPLIALLGPELKYRRSTLPTLPGEPAMQALEVEDERFTKQFIYFAATTPADLTSGAFGDCSAMVRWANYGWDADGRANAREINRANAKLAREMADQQLQSDIEAVKSLNLRIRGQNQRIETILTETTGRDYRLDRDAWNGWLASKMGKKYYPPAQVAKITIQDFVQPLYQPTFITVPPAPT